MHKTTQTKRSLVISEMDSDEEQAVAATFLEDSTQCVETLVKMFEAGSTFTLGPVEQHRHLGSSFDLAGTSYGETVSTTVLISPNMGEAEIWSTWALVLRSGGMVVLKDQAYQVVADEADDREKALLGIQRD